MLHYVVGRSAPEQGPAAMASTVTQCRPLIVLTSLVVLEVLLFWSHSARATTCGNRACSNHTTLQDTVPTHGVLLQKQAMASVIEPPGYTVGVVSENAEPSCCDAPCDGQRLLHLRFQAVAFWFGVGRCSSCCILLIECCVTRQHWYSFHGTLSVASAPQPATRLIVR